tara:strand:- start:1013 stop:1609 length:597 start_codon:yes stop_codon:yes gene_type:complete
MFEINNKKVEEFEHFKVIRDFYKNPDEVVEFIHRYEPQPHKSPIGYFSQGYDFDDMRHSICTYQIKPVWDFLSKVTKQIPLQDNPDQEYSIETNYTYFRQIYKDKHFYPHRDFGQTAMVYLDKDIANGTNIYKNISWDERKIEHKDHYCNGNEVEVIAHTPSEYNKLVIWDGYKLHGLCQDERYIDKWRLNQIFFFQQ